MAVINTEIIDTGTIGTPNNITILGTDNLQTTALTNSVRERLRIRCKLVSDLENIFILKDQTNILLIDCSHFSFGKIFDLLSERSMRSEHAKVALFNMKKNSRFESLIGQPQIKGIFYNTTQHTDLLNGLEYIIGGNLWLPRHLMQKIVNSHRKLPTFRASSKEFTTREQQILHSICRGYTNQDIARELALSEHTIKSHLYNLFKKHGFRNRLEACAWAKDQSKIGLLFDRDRATI